MLDSLILDTNDIYKMISKSEPMNYCVFILPNGIVEPLKIISDLNLKCTENDLYSEKLILEIYDEKEEAINRCNKFYKGISIQNFYVVCYKNGKVICSCV